MQEPSTDLLWLQCVQMLRSPELAIFMRTMTTTTQQQTYKPIALPLAHARGVKTCQYIVETDSPNYMLAIVLLYSILTNNIIVPTIFAGTVGFLLQWNLYNLITTGPNNFRCIIECGLRKVCSRKDSMPSCRTV